MDFPTTFFQNVGGDFVPGSEILIQFFWISSKCTEALFASFYAVPFHKRTGGIPPPVSSVLRWKGLPGVCKFGFANRIYNSPILHKILTFPPVRVKKQTGKAQFAWYNPQKPSEKHLILCVASVQMLLYNKYIDDPRDRIQGGNPMKTKILALLLAAVMLFGLLAACGNSADSAAPEAVCQIILYLILLNWRLIMNAFLTEVC